MGDRMNHSRNLRKQWKVWTYGEIIIFSLARAITMCESTSRTCNGTSNVRFFHDSTKARAYLVLLAFHSYCLLHYLIFIRVHVRLKALYLSALSATPDFSCEGTASYCFTNCSWESSTRRSTWVEWMRKVRKFPSLSSANDILTTPCDKRFMDIDANPTSDSVSKSYTKEPMNLLPALSMTSHLQERRKAHCKSGTRCCTTCT